MQIKSEQIKLYTITLSEDEFKLGMEAIGATSHSSRVKSGMTALQSQAMERLYEKMDEHYYSQ